MNDPKKERVLVPPRLSIRETAQIVDEAGLGIALVVDEERRLLGTVSDGDIRRAILKGLSLETPADAIMNREPVVVGREADMQTIRQRMLAHELKQIPVLDDEGRVLDLITMSSMLRVPLSNPDLTAREVQAVLDVLSTPNLSLGPKLAEFEREFAKFVGSKYAIAVNSGTSALHLCVKALGIKDGDEVITSPFSFIASANCMLFERATPVFADIEPDALTLDPARIEERITPRTKAILPVHVFGQSCDMDPIMEIAERRGLAVIEDACESIGATYKGRKVGTFGDCAVFSFYPNKQITTGEGGMITTDDPEIAKLCYSYRNQGRGETPGWLAHERLGYNYRLSELQCALGVVQLERLDEILAKRAALAATYEARLRAIPGILPPTVHPRGTVSWFVYVVQIDPAVGGRKERDEIIMRLRAKGIDCNNYFPPIHLQPFYRRELGFHEGMFPVTEEVSRRTIALPFYNNLERASVERTCDELARALADVTGRPLAPRPDR